MNTVSNEQLYLLRFCFLDGQPAHTAWQAWTDAVVLDDIDNKSFQLLPFAYRKLERLDIKSPDYGRLSGLYRQSWVKNQIKIRQLEESLACLSTAHIPTVVLSDVALAVSYYVDPGTRPIYTVMLMVQQDHAQHAIELLGSVGWQAKRKIPSHRLPFVLGTQLINQAGDVIHLRWHAFSHDLRPETDQAFWSRTVSCSVGEIQTLTLDRTAQLSWILCDEAHYKPGSLWGIADTLRLVQESQENIDWQWILNLAQASNVASVLKDRLLDLLSEFEAIFPPEIARKLEQLPVVRPRSDRKYLSQGKIGRAFASHWSSFHRSRHVNSPFAQVTGFITYLQNWWNLNHWWQVPLHIFRRLF